MVLVSQYTLTIMYNNSCTQNTSQAILSEVVNNDASEIVHYRTGLHPDTHYCFMLTATNQWGMSSQSEETCIHTPAEGGLHIVMLSLCIVSSLCCFL